MTTIRDLQSVIDAQNLSFDKAVQQLRDDPEQQVFVEVADIEAIDAAAASKEPLRPHVQPSGLRG